MRTGLAALALLFLAAHLPYLPPSLEDLDSVNFALGVQHFDVGLHRPHPPGYPVFIAMARVSTAVLRTAGVAAPEVRGLAVWSVIGGALTIFVAGVFFAAVVHHRRVALLAALLTGCAPLFWFTALRPLSDMAGLAAAFTALALMSAALAARYAPDLKVGPTGLSGTTGASGPAGVSGPSGVSTTTGAAGAARGLVAGAFVAGLAIGIRSQTFVMTLPLLAYIVLRPSSGVTRSARVTAVIAAAAGITIWMVPLVIASGGPAAYLTALGSQGAEDFSGVVMLWTHRTPRVAAYALLNTFVLPWDSLVLAGVVLVSTAAGAALLLWRSPGSALVLGLVFIPYAVFHLLFHEVVTVRYALPLVPLVACLTVIALSAIHERVAAFGVTVLAAFGVLLAVPPSAGFARQPSPVFRMLGDMSAEARGAASPMIVMHRRELTETRRPREWSGGVSGSLLPAPRDYEWLEAIRAWRQGAASPLWFVADPRRTDLALIDQHGRRTTLYRWPFTSAVYVGGARPDEMDWHVYPQPGWFLERGWALTPEVAGITERDGWGPHARPSEGWVRRDIREPMMLIGGRHLGDAREPPIRLVADVDGRPVLTEPVAPGFFLRVAPLPPGALAGDGAFAKLTVRAEPLTGGAAVPRVALEQFDLQARGVPMVGFDEGWQEPEYNPTTGRSWRWMSERAVLRVVNATAGELTLRMTGENPRRYYKTAPVLRVSVGGRQLRTFTPDGDFSYIIGVPAPMLAASGGRVTLESNLMFIPGDREGTADRRHLAIRIYSVTVDR